MPVAPRAEVLTGSTQSGATETTSSATDTAAQSGPSAVGTTETTSSATGTAAQTGSSAGGTTRGGAAEGGATESIATQSASASAAAAGQAAAAPEAQASSPTSSEGTTTSITGTSTTTQATTQEPTAPDWEGAPLTGKQRYAAAPVGAQGTGVSGAGAANESGSADTPNTPAGGVSDVSLAGSADPAPAAAEVAQNGSAGDPSSAANSSDPSSSGAPQVLSQSRQRASGADRASAPTGTGVAHSARLGDPAATRAAAAASALAVAGFDEAQVGGSHRRRTGANVIGGRTAARSAHSDSPVTGTVERIVGVVPRWVWIIVAVLALLTSALAAGSWLAALRARRLARQRRRLTEDVGALQAALLPAVPKSMSGVRTSVAYRPAEGPAAGGDFYDLFTVSDGRIAVIVGDVSGHGRAALPQTALIRYTARAYLDSGLTPRTALHAAAAALEHQLDRDCFATAVLATYDPGARTLAYACAGHPPPLVVGTEPLRPVLAAASPPIGLGMETGRRETIMRLPGAARACFFTDGVVEARAGGQLFGMERLARAMRDLGSDATAEALLARVVAETERRPDDMAACMLELEGAQVRVSVFSEELVVDDAELLGARTERFLAACGLDAGQVASTIRRARIAVDDAGRAVLRIHFGERGPRVEVEPAGRTFVRGARAQMGEAALGSSLVP